MKRLSTTLRIAMPYCLVLALALILTRANVSTVQADATHPSSHNETIPPVSTTGMTIYLPVVADVPISVPTGEPTPAPTDIPTSAPTSDPTATPTSVPTGEPTGEPTTDPTAIPTSEPTSEPTVEPTSTPTGESTGQLFNNGLFHGLNGVKIAALAASLAQTITVNIEVAVPSVAMLPDVTVHGVYYELSADRNLITSMQEPLLIGIPVPPGADTAHLSLALLNPLEPFDASSGLYWDFLDGLYDAETGRFLSTLSFLSGAGDIVALVEHPSFNSPPNGAVVQTAAVSGSFTVSCKLFSVDDCNSATEAQVAGMLDLVDDRMINYFGFTNSPRIRSPLGHIALEGDKPLLANLQGFTAYIVPHNYWQCERAAGLFRVTSGMIFLCYDPNVGITSFTQKVLIHEYFHATQFGYPAIYDPDLLVPQDQLEDWIAEGMAMLAEDSFFLDDDVMRNENAGYEELQKVDQSLTNNVDLTEYFAQDFWAYVGQRHQRNLGYLDPVLEGGGPTTADISAALSNEFSTEFHELYWGWVKNQVIENIYDLGDDTGEYCLLTDEALTPNTSPIVWNYDEDDYSHFPDPSQDPSQTGLYAYVEPLHAQVVEIRWPANALLADVWVLLEDCEGESDLKLCHLEAQNSLHSIIYVEGEEDCETYTDIGGVEGQRSLSPIDTDKRHFVVLANADFNERKGYQIRTEYVDVE